MAERLLLGASTPEQPCVLVFPCRVRRWGGPCQPLDSSILCEGSLHSCLADHSRTPTCLPGKYLNTEPRKFARPEPEVLKDLFVSPAHVCVTRALPAACIVGNGRQWRRLPKSCSFDIDRLAGGTGAWQARSPGRSRSIGRGGVKISRCSDRRLWCNPKYRTSLHSCSQRSTPSRTSGQPLS